MTNNKQSSVSHLIAEIKRRVAIIQSEPQTMARELMIDNLAIDLEQYKAMHNDEIETAMRVAFIDGLRSDDVNYKSPYQVWEQYYNEAFGGNNESNI